MSRVGKLHQATPLVMDVGRTHKPKDVCISRSKVTVVRHHPPNSAIPFIPIRW